MALGRVTWSSVSLTMPTAARPSWTACLFLARARTTIGSFCYTGRREDLETGLYYFRARYYSAQLGRFISRDPLGFVDGMNRYRAYFVPGGVDPIGLKSFMECVDDWGWDQFGCKTTFEADLAKCNSGWFYQDVAVRHWHG